MPTLWKTLEHLSGHAKRFFRTYTLALLCYRKRTCKPRLSKLQCRSLKALLAGQCGKLLSPSALPRFLRMSSGMPSRSVMLSCISCSALSDSITKAYLHEQQKLRWPWMIELKAFMHADDTAGPLSPCLTRQAYQLACEAMDTHLKDRPE